MFWNRFGSDDSSDIPPPDQLKGRPIGRVLTKMRKVTREQVVEALTYQKQHGGPLGEVMVKLGFIQPSDVLAALAGQRGEPPLPPPGEAG
jgi:hypothetical protein